MTILYFAVQFRVLLCVSVPSFLPRFHAAGPLVASLWERIAYRKQLRANLPDARPGCWHLLYARVLLRCYDRALAWPDIGLRRVGNQRTYRGPECRSV